jgi:hypothetical protein
LRTVASGGHRVGRKTNVEYGRERKYLTPAEVELLIEAAKKRGRYGQRDALAILMCYRHGLRVSELVALRWSHIAWEGTARLTVERRKGSVSGVAQALDKDEVRGLRQLHREQPAGTTHIFQGERGAVDVDWFRRMLRCSADCRWFTRTNSSTAVVMRWPTRGEICARSRCTLATNRSRTRSDMSTCGQADLIASGISATRERAALGIQS